MAKKQKDWSEELLCSINILLVLYLMKIMNRLILIGNGFDKAHGLATSYQEFIDWYWDTWRSKLAKSVSEIEG